jgi:hypothetical protein
MQENKILKWSLVLAIVIVANLFFNYSLSLIFNGPNYDEFCSFEKTSKVINDKATCESSDGIWNPNQFPKSPEFQLEGYCDLNSKCNNAFQEATKVYEKKVFISLVIIGAVVLIASAFLVGNVVLGAALPLVAVLDLIIASIRYWQYSDELLKVCILFIALVALVYLAIKKFKEKKHEGIQS